MIASEICSSSLSGKASTDQAMGSRLLGAEEREK